ncbi:MAG: C39 family peptidase [Chloroflexota bacterium]|nr:C39 family peptidase [Chloroflexota bacterium]
MAAIIVFVLSTTIFYFAWDYMPGQLRYLPRYIETHLLPARPHDEFVATPVVSVAPEQALESLRLRAAATPTPAEPEPTTVTHVEAVAPVEQAAQAESGAQEGQNVPLEPAAPVEPIEPIAEPAEPIAEPAEPTVELEPTAAPLFQPPLPQARLEGLRHEYQGWNNCGPATLAMNLSYFGRPETQEQTAPFLKPDEDDKNVSPNEMASYAHSIGYGARVLVGADLELLRTFLSNGIPVVVESWFIPEPDDQMGHYLLLVGYDGDRLTFFDSYNGPDVQEHAAEFDKLWKVFNRTAIVVWPPEQEALVMAILGDLTDQKTMYENALNRAHDEVNANPQDKFAWFNLGTNLTALGDVESAAQAFDMARSLQLPWRMLWYQFAPYEAYYNVGNYQEVINLATTTLNSADNLEESYYWRGRALEALGEVDAARRDLEQAIRFNPNFTPAHEALSSLP